MSGANSTPPLANNKCQVPIINDIKMTVSRKVDEDGSLCLEVKWRPIHRKRLCKVTSFELWYASWNSSHDAPSSDFADSDTSTANFHWIQHSALPLKSSTTTVCNLNATHYHQLQFRVTSLNRMITFNSHLYYFGHQSKLPLFNSSQIYYVYTYVAIYVYSAILVTVYSLQLMHPPT